MNSERKREIQVGIMVVVSVFILIGGLMFFKRVSLDSDMVQYSIDFPAVEGLRSGDRVQVRGIRAGQVTDFEFLTGTVRVHVELEDWVDLHVDAEPTLVMKGIVGEILIEIEPGSEGDPVPPGYIFPGRNAASMLALGNKINGALDEMTALSEEVRLFISQLRAEGQIVGPLAAAERTLLETEGMIKENRVALRTLTTGLVDLTADMQTAMGDGKLDSVLTATRNATVSLDSSMVVLRETTLQARAMLTRLEQGEGTVGRLLTDESLYDRADSTLESLDRLLDQMRRDPKSMFKMSVF